jgi:glycosyltransferase involved in cell wall biosynthesis
MKLPKLSSSKLPKLLVLVSPGGAAMYRDVAETCAALRDEYDLLVLAPPEERARFERLGIAFRKWRPAGFIGMGTSIRILRRVVERSTPDLVHAHGFPAASVALGTFPAALATRTIVTFHDPQRDKELPRKLVERRFPVYLARAAAVVATYPSLAQQLGQRLGLAPDTFAVIPHGVALPGHGASAPLARPALRKGPLVGWLGSLAADRAWETAIDGFKAVRERYPEARLEIGGTGRARQFIAAHVRQQKLTAAVTFRGDISAAELFAGIDVLVVPISRDAQPHPPLEALVAGVPLVAGNAGALADAVGEMPTGWLVDDDPEGIAAGIVAAWERIDEAWLGASEQRASAQRRYAREAVVARYRALYERALESASTIT